MKFTISFRKLIASPSYTQDKPCKVSINSVAIPLNRDIDLAYIAREKWGSGLSFRTILSIK